MLKKIRDFLKTGSIVWILEMVYIIGFMTVGFMEVCSLTFGKPVISFFLWPTLAIGGLVILSRLYHIRTFWKMKMLFLFLAFSLSYAISTYLSFSNDFQWYRNIRILILLLFSFFVVFPAGSGDGRRYMDKRWQDDMQSKLISAARSYYLFGSTALVAMSFYVFITGQSRIFYDVNGPIYYIGFHWGRLFGVFWDANIGALMSAGAILVCLYKLFGVSNRGQKAIYGTLTLLHLSYISFSGSRTGLIAVGAGCLIFFLLIFQERKDERTFLAFLSSLGKTVILISLFFGLMFGEKWVYNKSLEKAPEPTAPVVATSTIVGGDEQGGVEWTDENGSTDNLDLQRNDVSADVSNRRFDIWKEAIKIARREPVFGISHANVLPYVDRYMPDSYLVNNSQYMRFESMHNTFLDVLVAQGIIGFCVYLIIGLYSFTYIFLNRKALFMSKDSEANKKNIFAFSFIFAVVVASCVVTEIVYVTSPMSLMFWLLLGWLEREKEGKYSVVVVRNEEVQEAHQGDEVCIVERRGEEA